ncbi:hypothetical protein D6D19_10260, partial [Aureobasidium pullulans]
HPRFLPLHLPSHPTQRSLQTSKSRGYPSSLPRLLAGSGEFKLLCLLSEI